MGSVTLVDPTLDPLVSPDDVAAAMARIQGFVRRTPIISIAAGELGLGVPVRLKLELMQHTGSFKARGAFNRILSAEAHGELSPAGLIAASGGNHGAAVAFAARRLGLTAEIFVPATSPPMKRERIAGLGATVHVIDGLYDDAQAAANDRQAETGALTIHPYDHVDVVAGQGTMSLELDEQTLDAPYDTLILATGGGGFVAGQAAWLRDRVRVVSVEPETSNCLHAAMEAGHPVPVNVSGLAADSLGARQVGDIAWSVAEHWVDEAVLVTDDDIRAAQRALWDELRLIVEPGGAAALAGIRSGAYLPKPDERMVIVVCGSNADPATIT